MNASRIPLNKSVSEFRPCLRDSRARAIQYAVMSLPTWISLLGYLFSLAMTQTVYGAPFMNIRWVMLLGLAASSTADWILSGTRRGYRARGNNGPILLIYLLATFSTVVYAENWTFSGMRWTSHAAMLVIFVVFLPQIMAPAQTRWMLETVKYLMAALLVLSWFHPIAEEIPDTGVLYQGAMGNANTMGHIAFITALLFLQSVLTSKAPWIRFLSGALVAAAVFTVWQSGARSSMIALLVGALLLSYYYRRQTQGAVLFGILLGGLAMISFPTVPHRVSQFFLKERENQVKTSFTPIRSRLPVWTAAYEGFRKRPLVGWGFGADSSITKDWEVSLKAGGAVKRDAVNDFLFMMEGSGIIGLCSYLLLICIVLKQRPTRSQKSALRRFSRNREADSGAIALSHAHVALFILAACLLILNQFDNSALSAGNLISATTWLSAGSAAILRNELN